MLNQFNQFHQKAVQYNLSSSAILLWQYLYLAMARRNQFVRFHQDTAVLMAMLKLSRQGLFQARKSLEEVGLLAVEQDDRQKLWYSLQLGGHPVQPAQPQKAAKATTTLSEAAAQALQEPLAQQPSPLSCAQQDKDDYSFALYSEQLDNSMGNVGGQNFVYVASDNAADVDEALYDTEVKPVILSVGQAKNISFGNAPMLTAANQQGDIVMNQGYRAYLQAFCRRYENMSLSMELTQWMEQRAKNGWTLTLWGLEALLQKLVQLAAGQISAMVDIIRQSVKRRWKGFHPLKQQSRPSGQQLCKLEEKEQKAAQHWPSGKPKFLKEDRDLDFLMR